MSENLREQLVFLPEYLRGHLILTVAAMLLGVAVSVPLGVLATGVPRLKRPVLATVSVIQTIPSLAILALILALLGGRIGFLPAFLALTLYSMLPIVRNTVTGLENIPAEVIEAARGIGMKPVQILLKVRLPLALPVLIAGVRTATVWTVGLATLSTLVGATSLGNYIFSGIQTRNLTAVTLGSVVAAILALILDAAIGGVQWLTEQRGKNQTGPVRWAIRGLIPAVAMLLIVMGVFLARSEEYDYVVGGKGFTEQYIIAGLYASYLEDAGFNIDTRTGFGSDVIYEATANNNVAVYLEYSGTAWANHMKREDNPGREAIRDAVIEWLEKEDGIVTLGPTGFENLYALAMRRDRAEELGIETINDMAPFAGDLVCAGDLEFFSRPEWIRLRDTYNLDFKEKLTFDAALMYTAVYDRQVDVITAYSTDGRIAALDLAIIDDPRDALLPYDGLIAMSPEAAADSEFRAALQPIVGRITNEAMREANKIVDVDGGTVAEAVRYLRGFLDTGES